MSGIHNLIMQKLQSELQTALITNIPTDDPAIAGVVKIGPLQGDPDPDVARISVTIHENDPDKLVNAQPSQWEDEIDETECGGSVTWRRRFTIKARCLLVLTQENEADARSIASTIRSRIEKTLFNINFSGVVDTDGEYVSQGVYGENLKGDMVQGGGPPDAYDYHVSVRFEVLTTTTVGGMV
jgi:hypothetical protein